MRFHSQILSFFLLFACITIHSKAISSSVSTQKLTEGWKMSEVGQNKWIKATVPGCVHFDLLQNKLIPDPYYRTNEKDLQWIDKKDWEYNLDFELNAENQSENHAELVFEGLDTYADVYLNGNKVITADNMFLEYSIDIKKYIHIGRNSLRVYFQSPIIKGLELLKKNKFILKANNDQSENGGLTNDEIVSPFIRKAPYHFGWDWGPRLVTSGIWKPVYLRFWNDLRISDLYVEQKVVSKKEAIINVNIEIAVTKEADYKISIAADKTAKISKIIHLKNGRNEVCIPMKISNPKLWWTKELGNPYLYNITAEVSNKSYSDSKTQQIGIRSLKLIQDKDKYGHSFYFELNGVPVFAKGENHIPNDMFLNRVSKDVYDWEINTAVKSNLNMLRVWGGGIYEDDYFYKLCDKNGILIWQDFMFACALYPNNHQFFKSVEAEAEYQLKRLRNHPSIALWCGNNEIDVAWQNEIENGGWNWKQSYNTNQRTEIWNAYDTIFYQILPQAVRKFAAQTPYWQSTPSTITKGQYAADNNPDGDAHYWGVWGAKHPFERYSEFIGRFMSEYGFQSFPELESVKKYAIPEDYNIESEVMKHHQRAGIGNVTIKNYMDKYYQQPSDFGKFLYVGQVLQAYGLKYAMEAHRRAKPYNMGSIVWQINDCWPVASWSSCDYYHRWKALQYQIKRSFAPVIICAYKQNDTIKICIVSDLLTGIKGDLELYVRGLNGDKMNFHSIPINVTANSSKEVASFRTGLLTHNIGGSVLEMKISTSEKMLAEDLYYFDSPHNIHLLKPTITYKVKKVGATYEITLQSDVLAKDVYLNFSGIEGFFSDNYFDLIPGKTYKVNFAPKDSTKIKQALSIISLYDSYH